MLNELLKVLESSKEMVYEIGWDIPAMIIDYFDADYPEVQSLRQTPAIMILMKIFSLLSREGNPKELFLKAIEALTSMEITEEDRYARGERAFDVKFYAVFELMSYCLSRIPAQYPSRFLVTSTNALLASLALNVDTMSLSSLSIMVRRMFTFARDFHMADPPKPVADSEVSLVQRLLQSFITWTVDIALQRFSVFWSLRLQMEFRGHCEEQDKIKRGEKYELDELLGNVAECVERFSQLAYSYDMDLYQLFRELVEKAKTPRQPSEGHPLNNTEDPDKDPFTGLSDDGLLLLYTQVRFDDRKSQKPDLTVDEFFKLAIRTLEREDEQELAPWGVQDAITFWGLWVLKDVTVEQLQAVDKQEFTTVVQFLMTMAANGRRTDFSRLMYSIVARMLAMQDEKVTFDFLIDTLQYCPFVKAQDVTVKMLKDFTLRRKPSSNDTFRICQSTVEGLKNLSVGDDKTIINLDAGRKKQIQEMADKALSEVQESDDPMFSETLSLLLSWLNFLAVVDIDADFVKTFIAKAKEIPAEGDGQSDDGLEDMKTEASKRHGILQLAIESVEKRLSK